MSLMSRPPGESRSRQDVVTPLPHERIPGKSCDRCGCPARHHVFVPFRHGRHGRPELGELYFCWYHYSCALPRLTDMGLV